MKVYQKSAKESYTLGVFPTLELLTHQISHVKRVILNSKGERNDGIKKIRDICAKHHIDVEVNDRTIQKLSKKDNCYAIGVFEKYMEALVPENNHVVLVNPGDMGNLGTMIRTMLGFGISDLAIIRPGVDIYDPKVVRASMGAMFQLRFHYYDSFADYAKAFSHHHHYPMMLKGATSIHQVEKKQPFSVIFGNESSGLPDSFLEAGTSVLINQTDCIDSLNLSIALGITLYEFTRSTFEKDIEQ